ncbi:hypothetical protein GEOBC_02551 [Geobacteraceae bacterium]|nr:hypothetical protein GEOBC_02551 [Geobacteraceae bacterium]
MRKIRYGVVVLWMLLCCSATSVSAQVSIGIGLPHVSIGINLPLYPELVPVPGYPVYYAPRVAANYFFYDGLYWVYLDDDWYASYWYNGPWWIVEPQVVPVYILRVPVRYYRHPPPYFRGWRADAPPRWGKYWGHEWEQHRRGWDKWKRSSAPARAPLPVYQRQYSGDRYPRVEQQQTIRRQHYRYQPRDKAVRQHFQQPGAVQRAPAPAQRGRQEEPRMRGPGQQGEHRTPAPVQRGRQEEPRVKGPGQQAVPHSQPPHRTSPQQRGPAVQEQRVQPGVVRQAPRPQGQEQGLQHRGKPQEPGRGQGHNREGKEEERGQGRGN